MCKYKVRHKVSLNNYVFDTFCVAAEKKILSHFISARDNTSPGIHWASHLAWGQVFGKCQWRVQNRWVSSLWKQLRCLSWKIQCFTNSLNILTTNTENKKKRKNTDKVCWAPYTVACRCISPSLCCNEKTTTKKKALALGEKCQQTLHKLRQEIDSAKQTDWSKGHRG